MARKTKTVCISVDKTILTKARELGISISHASTEGIKKACVLNKHIQDKEKEDIDYTGQDIPLEDIDYLETLKVTKD